MGVLDDLYNGLYQNQLGYHLTGGPVGVGSIFGHLYQPDAPSAPPPPNMPSLLNSVDGNGNLKSQYQLNAQPALQYNDNGVTEAAQVNKAPLQALESYATGTGPSPWASLALQQNQNALNQQLGAASSNNNAATENAISDLAANGGATTGARERVAMQGSKNLLDTTQQARSAAQQNALGIQENDAQQRLSALEGLPSQEIAAIQPGLQAAEFGQQQKQGLNQYNQQYQTGVNQANITNAIGGLNNANQNALNIYGQQMAGYAANQTANAIQSSGGGGKKGASRSGGKK